MPPDRLPAVKVTRLVGISPSIQFPLTAVRVETDIAGDLVLSAELVGYLIQLELARIALGSQITARIQTEVLASSPAPLLALRKGPVPVETRAALRAKRRSRRKA